MTPTPSLILHFGVELDAANTDTRTISGKIVPFGGEIGNTSVGAVAFEKDSITFGQPSDVKLLLEHDNRQPIGRATSIETRPDGMYATFSIAPTTRGNDSLVEAATGLRNGLSVGVEVTASKPVNGVLTVLKSHLREVSLVESAAFKSAAVERVAASEPDEAEADAPAEADNPTEGETVNPEDQVTTSEETTETVEASAPVKAAKPAAPIFAKPRTEGMGSRDYLRHKIEAARGDYESMLLIKAADDDTSNNTGLTLPQHLNQFVTTSFGTRPAIDAAGGAQPLIPSGMSYTIPSLKTAPTVAVVAENQATAGTGMESEYITVDVVAIKGSQIVSWELIDRSTPAFLDLLMREMRRAYATESDKYVLDELLNGTVATGVSDDVTGLQTFIADESVAAYLGTGGMYATELLTNGAWWAELVKAQDQADRPLFPTLAPMNAPGQVGAQSSTGNVFGTNFRVDHNFTATTLVDDSAILFAPDAIHIAESPVTEVRVNVIGNGQLEIGVYGYIASKLLIADGVRVFNKQ